MFWILDCILIDSTEMDFTSHRESKLIIIYITADQADGRSHNTNAIPNNQQILIASESGIQLNSIDWYSYV